MPYDPNPLFPLAIQQATFATESLSIVAAHTAEALRLPEVSLDNRARVAALAGRLRRIADLLETLPQSSAPGLDKVNTP